MKSPRAGANPARMIIGDSLPVRSGGHMTNKTSPDTSGRTKNEHMKYLLIGLFFYMGSSVACNRGSSGTKGVLPAAQLINETGEVIDLSSFKGKKVFVNLWATWCPPCVAEMPSIQELYNQTRNSNTEFVMLSLDKNFDVAKQWAKQKNYNLPLYFASGDLHEALQVAGIPTTFIFDEEGNMIFNHVGSEDYSRPKFLKMLTGNSDKK